MRREITPGTMFGRLTVLEEMPPITTPSGQYHRAFLCICECGNKKTYRYPDLSRKDSGRTRSCGCLKIEVSKTLRPPTTVIHGLTSCDKTHYIYTLWKGIKRRCLNHNFKQYEYYGGRGIKMHSDWVDSPAGFYVYIKSALGDRPSQNHSLDRIDVNGDYAPGNLRWATPQEQQWNKRCTVRITCGSKTLTIPEWSKLHNIPAGTIASRLFCGWDPAVAVSKPSIPHAGQGYRK